MNINISLSTESIQNAVDRLRVRLQHLEEDAEQFVDILTNEGAEVAQSHYGEWGVQATPVVDGTEGAIVVSGDMPLIAEFGAGDATLPVWFENIPAEVRKGSYSEEHARQYSRWGFWYFAGETYTESGGLHGLLNAKRHIMDEYIPTAMEVMKYD